MSELHVPSAAELNLLRTTQHKTRLYLAVYHPASLWTATVNGNHASGATAIAVSGTAGSTPVANYEVWFGSALGLMDVGRGRVKGFAGATLTIAPNNFDFAGGEFITVKENILPVAVQPKVGTTVLEDWDTAYTNQNLQYRPLARMGAPACAFRDEVTGLATISLWSDSEALSGALASYLWTVPGAVFTVGNATTAGTALVPNVVTVNTSGQYWWSLKVTDSNGNIHTTYRPIFVFDRHSGTLPYSQLEIQSLEGNQEAGGWSLQMTVRGVADRTQFPELSQIVLFADDHYGDTLQSIGGDYVGRENIVLVGFIREGSVRAHAWNQSVEFQASGIGVFAQELPGYPFNLVSATTPAGWHEMSGLTYKLAAYHTITEHSTLDLIADLDLSPLSYTADKLDLVQSTLLDQVAAQCLAPVRSVFGSSRLGRLVARQQPQLNSAASRTEPISLTTTNSDIRDQVEITSEAEKKAVSQVDFQAYNFNSTHEQQPVLSLAPCTPWETGRFDTVSGIRVSAQADSNIISGYFEGRANNPYPDITVKWRGNYRLFDVFPVAKTRINLSAAQNNRGVVWSNAVLWPKRVVMTYTAGILLTECQYEKDVVGNPGCTGNYPSEPPSVPPPPSPPVIPPPETIIYPDGPEVGLFRSKVFVSTQAKGIFYSTNFTEPAGAMPSWATVNTGLPTLSIKVMAADPFRPSQRQYCMVNKPDDYDLGATYGVFRRTTGAWSNVFTVASMVTLFQTGSGQTANALILQGVSGDVNHDGAVWAMAEIMRADAVRFVAIYRSNDYGATWTLVYYVALGTNISPRGLAVGLFKGNSSYAAGNVIWFGSGHITTGSKFIHESVNRGVAFTTHDVSAMFNPAFNALQMDINQDVIYVYTNSIAANPGLWRSLNRGSTWTKIGPTGVYCDGNPPQANGAYKIMPLYDPTVTPKANVLRVVNGVANVNDIYKSVDSGVNWVQHVCGAPLYGSLASLGILALGDASSKLYGIVQGTAPNVGVYANHYVWASDNEGETWTGKSGADVTPATVNGIPSDCGGIVGILPCYD